MVLGVFVMIVFVGKLLVKLRFVIGLGDVVLLIVNIKWVELFNLILLGENFVEKVGIILKILILLFIIDLLMV